MPFKMNGCPRCKLQLRFYGIQTRPVGTEWRRWTICDSCNFFTGYSENGIARVTTKETPPDGFFVRTIERTRDEGRHQAKG